MADSYFSMMLNALRGGPPSYGPPEVTTTLAPPLPEYPTQHDADYARNYGFGDNSVNEDYLNNNKARVLGTENPKGSATGLITASMPEAKRPLKGFMPLSGADITRTSLYDPKNNSILDLNQKSNNDLQGKLTNTMMRAALAANRSPIASLGFDPSKVIVDSMIKNGTIGGQFNPNLDAIYTTLSPDDSVLHESTHRGIEKLQQQFPDKAGELLKQLPDEEYVVRWLMKSKGGDPEGFAGEGDAKQRQQGINYFGTEKYPHLGARNRETLKQLEELAIESVKGRSRRAGPQ